MPDQPPKPPPITTATRLSRQQKGGPPLLIGRAMANQIISAVEALLNLKLIQPQTDGTAVQNQTEADVKVADGNMIITLQPQLNPDSAGGGGGGSAPTWVRYKDDLGDCLECVLWDGTTEGSTVYVAKPRKIRTTLTSEVIAGLTYGYSYALGTADTNGNHYLTRSVVTAVTETDGIIPPYVFDDELWAFTIPSITLNSQACVLLDQNVDGRAWGEE